MLIVPLAIPPYHGKIFISTMKGTGQLIANPVMRIKFLPTIFLANVPHVMEPKYGILWHSITVLQGQ
jgi:hypothetical protein